ncbi:hypothetical protein ACFWQC_25120 [Nocardioides sp. NPDC058538]|uniref:hypothetical protein n=1 Tax=Nocardioides sp. NPDC058538 TaxID=3346542 RepID=UPI0036666EAD
MRQFRMRQKLASIDDDFWIDEDDQGGDRPYRVNGKAPRAKNTSVLEGVSGTVVAPESLTG